MKTKISKSVGTSIMLVIMTMLMCFTSCHYSEYDMSKWDMSQKTRDSLQFKKEHHYTFNYNFKVLSDSLILRKQLETENVNDSISVFHGDRIVVADIQMISKDSVDSVWVKVAKDQDTMGWIQEKTLLKGTVPTDPISQFIHLFSGTHIYWFIAIIFAAILFYVYRMTKRQQIRILFYNDVDSSYPTLLCLLMAGEAVLYGSIQLYVPETWQEFYFHPTLNPFSVPFILSCFIVCFWLIIIVSISAVDEVFRKQDFITAVTYLSGLGLICVLCYLFFTLSTITYIGYPCFLFFLLYSIYHLRKLPENKYFCGNCGKALLSKGECPYCGAINE